MAAFSGESPTFEDKDKLLAAVKPRPPVIANPLSSHMQIYINQFSFERCARERERDKDKESFRHSNEFFSFFFCEDVRPLAIKRKLSKKTTFFVGPG